MTTKQLTESRVKLGLNRKEMALQLQTPYRTYQQWENGSRRIPGICRAAVSLLLERDRRFMENMKERVMGQPGR
jgi:DNA-binding transcriptional regulator YiaG